MSASPRLFHGAAVIAVTFANVVAGSVIALSLNVSNSVPWETPHRNIVLYAAIGLAAVLALALLAIIRHAAWSWITLAALVPTVLFVYLVHDESPYAMPDLGLRAESDDPGYRTLMWFGRGSPYSRLDEMAELDAGGSDEVRLPPDPQMWGGYAPDPR